MSSRRRWPPESEETLRSATADRSRSVGPQEGDQLALPDLEVEGLHGLDGLLARGEVAGEATGHDRRSGVVVVSHERNAKDPSGQFLSALNLFLGT